jgi:hypothetical protein
MAKVLLLLLWREPKSNLDSWNSPSLPHLHRQAIMKRWKWGRGKYSRKRWGGGRGVLILSQSGWCGAEGRKLVFFSKL